MDKQDEGLKLLKDINDINKYIKELQEKIEMIQTELVSTTVKPKEVDVQSSGSQDPMADKVIKKLEYIKLLEEQQALLISKRSLAFKVLTRLDNEQKRILFYMYFDEYPHTIEETAEHIGYSYKWMWEKIHAAEQRFMEMYSLMC